MTCRREVVGGEKGEGPDNDKRLESYEKQGDT
jgi:hypothetical protein